MNKHRDASNRLTYDFHKIESSSYISITKELEEKFNLEPSSKLVQGLDEIFQEYKVGNKSVGLEWDIWSGYIVNAKNIESESLASEIASFINANHYS